MMDLAKEFDLSLWERGRRGRRRRYERNESKE